MSTSRGGASRSIDWVDRAALAGSFTCMVHCLALPLAMAALPALSSIVAVPESFHLWVLAFAAPAAAIALVAGHARHGAACPLLLGALGIALLAWGTLLLKEGWPETIVTVTGSLGLASAHIVNWRLRHASCGIAEA